MSVKTLFFGFDGLEPGTLERMIAEGVMPNFKALREASHRADIGVYPGFGAGAFWGSGATGVPPADHGRYFHLQFNQDTYDALPFHQHGTYRKEPFWQKLDREGKKVFVLDWHRGPFHEMSNGLIVDNWLGHDAPGPVRSDPPQAAEKILERYGSDPIAGGYGNHKFESYADHRAFADAAVDRIETKARMCVDYLKADDWDLFIPCFTELHDIGHYYMHLAVKNHEAFDPDALEIVGDPLRACYLAIDRAVGAIREAAGKDVTVVMLAGPGMEPMISATHAIEEIATKLDLGATPPATPGSVARQTYRNLIPLRWRRRWSKIGRKARRTFADNDFKKRRFFGVPHNDNAGCIRVNVKGREKFGIVERGEEYEKVLQEIKEGMLALRDVETGAPVVSNVYFTQHELSGKFIDDLPDVFAEWNRVDHRKTFRAITSERTGVIKVPENLRSGDHTRNGCFWSTGANAELFAPTNESHMPHEIVEVVLETLSESTATEGAEENEPQLA